MSSAWSPAKPRARLTRCCSPPENVAGGSGQRRSGRLRRVSREAARAARRLGLETGLPRRGGDDVERGDARDDAQKLADVAHDTPPGADHLARAGGGDIEKAVAVGQQDASGVGPIGAEDDFENRRFAHSRRAAKHDALPPPHGESDPMDHRQPQPPMQMKRERLVEVLDDKQVVWPTASSYREHRGYEQLRIGRLGVVEHPVGQSALDHLAALHDQNPV